MNPAVQAIFSEWSPPWGVTAAVVLVSVLYVRGWLAIRRTRPRYFSTAKLVCFLSGMATLWLAIASPIDGFADVLLTAHMFQHTLLMSVVPPLVLLGAPVVPLLRGLPRWCVRNIAGPLMTWRWSRWLGHVLLLPSVAWLSFNLVFLGWHVPIAYDFALRDETVHDIEHLCFLFTALLFWAVILHPWPQRQRANGWMLLLYLVSADIVNTVLSAFLVFGARPIYGYYIENPNPFGIAPMPDQVAAGAMMWVVNSTVFLIPAMLLTVQLAGFGGDSDNKPHGTARAVSA